MDRETPQREGEDGHTGGQRTKQKTACPHGRPKGVRLPRRWHWGLAWNNGQAAGRSRAGAGVCLENKYSPIGLS